MGKRRGWVTVGEGFYAHPDALDKLRKELYVMSHEEPEKFKALIEKMNQEHEQDKGEPNA